MDPKEQRQTERIPVNLAVSFRELGEAEAARLADLDPLEALPAPVPAAAGLPGPSDASGHSENLSLGGLSLTGDLQILGERRLARGSKLLVEFHLPEDDAADPVRAAAVVAWCLEGHGPHGKFTAGLMFLGIKAADLGRIQRYVEGRKAP